MTKPKMIGRRFGLLKVLKENGRANHGAIRYDCICDCGAIKNCCGQYLRQGKIQSCGCMKYIWIAEANLASDLSGKRFGKLKVIRRSIKIKNDSSFLCKCDCGTYKNIRRRALITGTSKTCGCSRKKSKLK